MISNMERRLFACDHSIPKTPPNTLTLFPPPWGGGGGGELESRAYIFKTTSRHELVDTT